MRLIAGHWYVFIDRMEKHTGQYIGRQKGFECGVCRNGCNAHTFNIWNSELDYETWGYGAEHLPFLLKDLGESETEIIDE